MQFFSSTSKYKVYFPFQKTGDEVQVLESHIGLAIRVLYIVYVRYLSFHVLFPIDHVRVESVSGKEYSNIY